MRIDVLVAEIGSTTTVINAFNGFANSCPIFIGQGHAPTSVLAGDVRIGLNDAILNLKSNLGEEDMTWDELFATSSAAGGLRMTVHGLVYDMTVRAAKEAALGAGGIIKNITAGKLRKTDLIKIREINPNIILVAGGVDYGERETSLFNFEQIAALNLGIPMIYAGNCENHDEIRLIANEYKIKLYIVENVYPMVDVLNVEPTRRVIQEVFEEHISNAPGMNKIRDIVNGHIIPTPGAVMEATKLIGDSIGDVVVFDVGGATTDVHSYTDGSIEVNKILTSPEPKAKRTVEGDLGVYVNIKHVAERIDIKTLTNEFENAADLIENAKPIPETDEEKRFIEYMTNEAVLTALERHAGKLRHLFGPTGKKTIAEGKDLTNVEYIIGTGGALTRLPKRINILESVKKSNNALGLYPNISSKILVDNHYIMASLGVLSTKYPQESLLLLKASLGIT